MTCEFMACHFTYNLLIDVENWHIRIYILLTNEIY
jgi:hypothetical protein